VASAKRPPVYAVSLPRKEHLLHSSLQSLTLSLIPEKNCPMLPLSQAGAGCWDVGVLPPFRVLQGSGEVGSSCA
jgi:hypothetical protein